MDYNKTQGVIRNDANFQKQSNQAGYTSDPVSNQTKNPYTTGGGYNPPPVQANRGYAQVNQDNIVEDNSEFTGLFDLKRSGHPVAGIFHVLFKGLAIFFYLFLYSISGNTIITFILVIISSAFDFWTVKNVSGRLLVGLRWWSEFNELGQEKWHFESHDGELQINPIDKRIFWWSQMGAVGFWALISFLNLISFSFFWGVCSGICLSLTGTNYWGYHKCSKGKNEKKIDPIDQQNKIKSIWTSQGEKIQGKMMDFAFKGLKFFGRSSS